MSDTANAATAVHVDTETFVCQGCGGVMKFDIKSQKFVCGSCKTEWDLETLSDTVKEYDFAGYREREGASVAFEGMAVASCGNCGLDITFANQQIAAVCPMCGSTQIAEGKQRAGIPPEGVVPFKVDKQDAQQKFRVWAKSRWFAPNEFKKRYQEGALAGLYLPFWTYDASVLARYEGDGGRNRQVRDKDGKTRTVTDWFPVSGTVTSVFDDVLVCASDKEKRVDGILPYNTVENAKPYAAGYLSGYYAELYTIKADTAFEKAKTVMEREMKELARARILRQYDAARIHTLRATYTGVTYKHVLLPMWSSTFYYKNKTYGYLINGETGKVNGSRPYSAAKITAAVITALAAVILAIVLFGGDGSGDDYGDDYSMTRGVVDCCDTNEII